MSRTVKLGRLRRRRNPSRKLKVELRREGGYWSVYVNGARTVDRESFSVADRIKQELERPSTRHTEAGEVAESIRKHFTANPARKIRSTRRFPVMGEKRRRGKHRVSMFGGSLGDANFHAVQVKRSTKWITLAGFPRGEFGRARATEYGKLLARRYPRQKFRVFWPDALTRKKNPAPRADARGGAQVDQAARLYAQFTGHPVGRARRVALPAHTAGLAIGPVLGVAYATTRDGKREKYLHDFRRGARPTLAASFDGRQLYMLGGAYRFTERGIVDR